MSTGPLDTAPSSGAGRIVPCSLVADLTPGALAQALRDAASRAGARSLVVLLAGRPDARPLTPVLRAADLPLIGGCFPKVFVDGQVLESGGVVLALPTVLRTARLDLTDDAGSQRDALARHLHLPGAPSPGAPATVVTFFDAAMPGIEAYLERLYDLLGPEPNYAGGGAGGLDLVPQACVIDNDGVHEGAAVVGLLEAASTAAVGHGWAPAGGEARVTRSAGRRIQRFDHRPASAVYRELVVAAQGGGDFEEAAPLSYPLGVVQVEDDPLVRDVIDLDGDDLVLVAETSRWAVLQLLHGDIQSLLEAAATVAGQLAPAVRADRPGLLFDCISRTLHMEERFADELRLFSEVGPFVGAATIGEVCNLGDRFIDLYNKTVVAVAFTSEQARDA